MKNNKLFMSFLEEEATSGGQAPWGKRTPDALKEAWHRFVAVRYQVGKCIQCQRKHVSGQQRCRLHKEVNRLRAARWTKLNQAHIAAKIQDRRNAGVCINSPTHGKAHSPSPYCQACREKKALARKALTYDSKSCT